MCGREAHVWKGGTCVEGGDMCGRFLTSYSLMNSYFERGK